MLPLGYYAQTEARGGEPLVTNNKVDLRRDKPSWTNQAAMPSAITVGLVPYTDNNKKHISMKGIVLAGGSGTRLLHDYQGC